MPKANAFGISFCFFLIIIPRTTPFSPYFLFISYNHYFFVNTMLRETQRNLNGIFIDIYNILRYPTFRLFVNLWVFIHFLLSKDEASNFLLARNCGRDSMAGNLKKAIIFYY